MGRIRRWRSLASTRPRTENSRSNHALTRSIPTARRRLTMPPWRVLAGSARSPAVGPQNQMIRSQRIPRACALRPSSARLQPPGRHFAPGMSRNLASVGESWLAERWQENKPRTVYAMECRRGTRPSRLRSSQHISATCVNCRTSRRLSPASSGPLIWPGSS
jgi:hypothetical protein